MHVVQLLHSFDIWVVLFVDWYSNGRDQSPIKRTIHPEVLLIPGVEVHVACAMAQDSALMLTNILGPRGLSHGYILAP